MATGLHGIVECFKHPKRDPDHQADPGDTMRPVCPRSAVVLATRAVALMCAIDPSRLRVCTFGGEGACSGGAGDATLAALQFLAPADGTPTIVGCSCLARCDRGVAVQLNSEPIEEQVNGPERCAALLRRIGCEVDARLAEAFGAAQRGDQLVEEGKAPEALQAYNQAFNLAADAGIGIKWRSKPSSVVRVRVAAKGALLEPGKEGGMEGGMEGKSVLALIQQLAAEDKEGSAEGAQNGGMGFAAGEQRRVRPRPSRGRLRARDSNAPAVSQTGLEAITAHPHPSVPSLICCCLLLTTLYLPLAHDYLLVPTGEIAECIGCAARGYSSARDQSVAGTPMLHTAVRPRHPIAACTPQRFTTPQVRWLVALMTRRSSVYSTLAAQGQVRYT